MSTADRTRAAGVRGFTFLEVAVVMVLVVTIVLVVERSSSATGEAAQYLAGLRRAIERHQQTSLELRDVVGPSRRLLTATTDGPGYLEACDFGPWRPVPGARLPTIEQVRPLGADLPGDPRTGNVLLLARDGDAATCVADAATGRLRAIDRYRLVAVFPSDAGTRLDARGGAARDLVVWRSRPYASHAQLLDVVDAAERRSVVRDLVQRFGCAWAWDPSLPASEGFYELMASGDVAPRPERRPRVEADPDVSDGGRLVYAGVQLGRTEASALNRSLLTDESDAWVPDGFEVKVAGPSSGRRVWIRLTLMATAGAGRMAGHAGTFVIDVRDM